MGISRTGFYSHAWLFLRWCIWNWGVFLSAVICPAPMCVGESYCGLLIGNQKMMLWSTTVGLWELLATTISNESLSDMTLVEMFTDKLMFERFIPVRWVGSPTFILWLIGHFQVTKLKQTWHFLTFYCRNVTYCIFKAPTTGCVTFLSTMGTAYSKLKVSCGVDKHLWHWQYWLYSFGNTNLASMIESLDCRSVKSHLEPIS